MFVHTQDSPLDGLMGGILLATAQQVVCGPEGFL